MEGIAGKHGLRILEDACQADGGTYHGRHLGTVGDAGAFSFNYFKIVTAGEGGALVTDDRTIYERALIYHDAAAVAFFGDQLDGVTEKREEPAPAPSKVEIKSTTRRRPR